MPDVSGQRRVLQFKHANTRVYNPDRDLAWAFPRLMRSALARLGTLDINGLREHLVSRSVRGPVDDTELWNAFEGFINEMNAFLKEMAGNRGAIKAAQPFLDRLYTSDRTQVRLLIADLMLEQMFCELPVWFESVHPSRENEPAPPIEEVEDAARQLLEGRE